MFTIQQTKEAHDKVKSGADFPYYIKDLKQLGVLRYSTWVTDGHTEFEGANDYRVKSDVRYAEQIIAETSNAPEFINCIKEHQAGKTDYYTVSAQAAENGVEKWIVDLQAMTCTYYDKAGNKLLEEEIPVV